MNGESIGVIGVLLLFVALYLGVRRGAMAEPKYFLWIEEKVKGPFTAVDILEMVQSQMLSGSVLCATDINNKWQPVMDRMATIRVHARQWPKAQTPVIAANQTTVPTGNGASDVLVGVGIMLCCLAIMAGIYFAFVHEITAPGSEIINAGRLNDRTLGFGAALVGALIGSVFIGAGVVSRKR